MAAVQSAEPELEPPLEQPELIDEPDSAEDDDYDDDDEEDVVSLCGALHGLEPLEPGAEPRQRIGTSKCGISKKSWTKGEDAILTQIVEEKGAQRWSSVAAQLPGRAGKQCRERYAFADARSHTVAQQACVSACCKTTDIRAGWFAHVSCTGGLTTFARRSRRARGLPRRTASSWNRWRATARAGRKSSS